MVYCWQKNWQILNRTNSTVGSGIQLPLCDTSAIQEPNVYSHNLWYRQTWITDESNRSNKWRNIPLPPYFRDHLRGMTVSSCTAERKMPQAFPAPSAEPHKEARPQAASCRHLHGPRGTNHTTPRRAPRSRCGAHTALRRLTAGVELLEKGTRMGELWRLYKARAGNPIHTKVRDMPKVRETLRLEGHLDIIYYILFLKEGQSCLTVSFLSTRTPRSSLGDLPPCLLPSWVQHLLFLAMKNLPHSPQPFKGSKWQPHGDLGQLPPHLWLHPIQSQAAAVQLKIYSITYRNIGKDLARV